MNPQIILPCTSTISRPRTRPHPHPHPHPRQWISVLSAMLDLAGDTAVLLGHTTRPWASVTFSGSKHTLTLQFTRHEALQAFADNLNDHEFAIPHYLVADTAILTQTADTITVQLLLLDNNFTQ